MVYAPQPKKMIIMNILDILNKYSDVNHKLTQSEIQRKLETEYAMQVDRKAVRRNLFDLIEGGYGVECRKIKRNRIDSETGEHEDVGMLTDFYIEREFDDSEIKLLLDSVIFSPHIPQSTRNQLIKKIEKLSSVYFQKNTKSIEVINSVTSQNTEWFLNLEIINEAIAKRIKIRFSYNEYGIDKKLHPAEEVTVCPYRIIAHNSHYYLLSNEPPFDNFVHYRIDRITNLIPLEKETFPPLQSFDLNKYLHSHPSMFSGQEESIKIIADKSILGDIFDSFGGDVRIRELDNEPRANKRLSIHRYDVPIMEFENGPLEITLKSARTDFYHWALQYGDKVEVISPKDLRVQIRETVEIMAKTYLRNNEDKLQKALDESRKSGFLDLRRIDLRDVKIDDPPENLKELRLGLNLTHDYSFVGRFRGLRCLRINNRVDDFTFLSCMTSLTHLLLRNTGFNDLSLIKDLALKKLYLEEERVEHMELVYEMHSLEELALSRNLIASINTILLREINPQIVMSVVSPAERSHV